MHDVTLAVRVCSKVDFRGLVSCFTPLFGGREDIVGYLNVLDAFGFRFVELKRSIKIAPEIL